MRRYLTYWLLATTVACAVIFARARMELAALPDTASARWAHAALEAARRGDALPTPPPSALAYRARGPIFVQLYWRGRSLLRHVGSPELVPAIEAAAARISRSTKLRIGADGKPVLDSVFTRTEATRGQTPLHVELPGLSLFALVPLLDGISAELDGRRVYLTPDEILAQGAYDSAVVAPVPDLTFGTDVRRLREQLARALGTSDEMFRLGGKLRRLRIEALAPRSTEPSVDLETLRTAVRESTRFVLRHQDDAGRYTYIYDARRNRRQGRAYSLTRHAGTTFFLAQVARSMGLPEATDGALRALAYVKQHAWDHCGASDRACVIENDRVAFGATALTALAAAELLPSVSEPQRRAEVQRMLETLLAFVRSQQRPDGELMHEYDRKTSQPMDVQHMYYSGEAALALLTAYDITRDDRDLETAKRLMSHLTGAGWSFFGSRYFYGEEHWTCQAVAKAAPHMELASALEFCLRWGRFQDRLQYRKGQTPWPVEGALGVGPVIVPRINTAASRVEAMVPIYRVVNAGLGGRRAEPLLDVRAFIERSAGLLLRMRWAPGPAHLFASPSRAEGGMPSTAAELTSRVDMVQHAGSAWLAWSEVLAAERASSSTRATPNAAH